MDMEWAKDGETGDLYIVQARPETIHAGRDYSILKEYRLKDKAPAVLVKGASVGSAIAQGKARVIMDAKQAGTFKKGEILVTDMTDPDWEPIMKMASAIITDKGGRTSHAAIVSRELGIPAIVGTEQATRKIKTGMALTVDTTGGDGLVYPGTLPFKVETHTVKNLPQIHTKVMVNVAMPEEAFQVSLLPVAGVGLAREEFIIASEIGMHPLALLNEKKLDAQTRKLIDQKTRGAKDKAAWYVERLASGIGTIGAAFFPRPVIVRFSDFKTNEYRTLLGGELFEPKEENPMIGWRGASRYYDPRFKDAFILECKALQKVRDTMGLTNVIPMVPFCRTPEEGKKTRAIMKAAGLESPCYVMCEIPANVMRANEFLDIFDGMSIGSNDLTQLALGLDRDAGMLKHIGNENDPTVKALVSQAIDACKARGKYIGICGQAPSDHPDFLEFLIEKKIESVSLNPDTVINAIQKIGAVEART
jgi:pyruvate,water dikinase